MPRDSPRGRLRSYEACLNCRRKKTRCPAERPACSTCARLNQSCLYSSSSSSRRPSSRGPSEDRLASLEEKVNFIMKGSRPPPDKISEPSDPSPESTYALNDFFAPEFATDDASLHLSSPTVTRAVDLYFQYCHRQPIWCFNYEDLEDMGVLPRELVYSLLTLTARFSRNSRDQAQYQYYCSTARTLIMLRVSSGTVDLETIESLCLLAYSFFMDGNVHLGQFHLGFAFQLCLSALLDVEAASPAENPLTQRKKRIFWSLLSLEQSYGHPNGVLRVSAETLCPCCVPVKSDDQAQDERSGSTPPPPQPIHRNEMNSYYHLGSSDVDIWSLAVHFGWVWSKLRMYVSDCAQNKLKEPWRHDSMYSIILSDLTEAENKLSQCHRYDSVKFYERKADEVRINRGYWGPWLKLQFTYHCILMMLNHPFLYIVASQHNPNLAIPNAFWRRSSELALLHATWIVRIIDMVSEKKIQLTDPLFGHAAAIATTVHLYYCRAADPRLKFKSKTDLAKCRRFLEGFVPFSPVCQSLDQTLEKILHIAFGSENVDYDWNPSRIYLSVSLMWDVLRANCSSSSLKSSSPGSPPPSPSFGLFHPGLVPAGVTREGDGNSSTQQQQQQRSLTLEIIVATSPEVTVNTADGGQAAHMPPKKVRGATPVAMTTAAAGAPPFSPPESGGSNISILGETLIVPPNDDLMLNTPWLWTTAESISGGSGRFAELESNNGGNNNNGNAMDDVFSWWDLGNL